MKNVFWIPVLPKQPSFDALICDDKQDTVVIFRVTVSIYHSISKRGLDWSKKAEKKMRFHNETYTSLLPDKTNWQKYITSRDPQRTVVYGNGPFVNGHAL